jgi:hypothetical protein
MEKILQETDDKSYNEVLYLKYIFLHVIII